MIRLSMNTIEVDLRIRHGSHQEKDGVARGSRSLSAMADETTCEEVGERYDMRKEAMLATFKYFASIVAHED